ncbi:hypothetical protein ABZ814_13470 [Micromonospora musae]|uniref:hypothetical protein n=1 Tax=Micromonospora musae TaxID=1894970 RepID=UPI0033E8FECF
MTEQNTGAGAPETAQSTFTQADVDRIVADRLGRERGKYADYDQLKAKAGEFDKLAEAQKTEAEKSAERLTAAERKAADAELSSLRLDVALDKAPEGMPVAQVRKLARRLTGTTKDELEADAAELFGDFKPAAATSTRRPIEALKPGALPAGQHGSGDPNQWMRDRASRA